MIDSINIKAQLLFLACIFFFSYLFCLTMLIRSDDVVSSTTTTTTDNDDDGYKEYIQSEQPNKHAICIN
jgi:hypothetical protein